MVVAIILVWPAFNLKGDQNLDVYGDHGCGHRVARAWCPSRRPLFIRFCGLRFVRQIPMEVRYDCF